MWIKLLIIVSVILLAETNNESVENINNNEEMKKTLPKKLLARRREEHLVLLKNIALNPKYEWRFKLVEVGVSKVFELINENRDKIKNESKETDDKLSEAKMIVIENACLLMDFIVNFNEDIYKIFSKISKKNPNIDPKLMLETSFNFLKENIELIDELTLKEYNFIMENWEKIDKEEILPEYPYENSIKRDINISERLYGDENDKLKALKKKERKKLKKGPALRSVEL